MKIILGSSSAPRQKILKAIQKEPFTSHIKKVKGELETIIGLPKEMTQKFLKELL